MSGATWYGTKVLIDKVVGPYVNVTFLESCTHFRKGARVTFLDVNIKRNKEVTRYPVIVKRSPWI